MHPRRILEKLATTSPVRGKRRKCENCSKTTATQNNAQLNEYECKRLHSRGRNAKLVRGVGTAKKVQMTSSLIKWEISVVIRGLPYISVLSNPSRDTIFVTLPVNSFHAGMFAQHNSLYLTRALEWGTFFCASVITFSLSFFFLTIFFSIFCRFSWSDQVTHQVGELRQFRICVFSLSVYPRETHFQCAAFIVSWHIAFNLTSLSTVALERCECVGFSASPFDSGANTWTMLTELTKQFYFGRELFS